RGAGAPPVPSSPAPAPRPPGEVVPRRSAGGAPALGGRPPMLRQLAGERRAGRLRIAPTSVTTLGEPLTPADAGSITEAFGVGVIDMFVSTEGLVGHSEPGGTVLSFGSDLCLAELVDE